MEAGVVAPIDLSNAVYPIEIQSDDPNYIDNLVNTMHKLNVQSAADTKYDPVPHPRVNKEGKVIETDEGFEAAYEASDTKLTGQVLYLLGAFSGIILIMAVFAYVDPKMLRSITEVKNGVRYLAAAAVVSVINLIFIYFSMKKNEVMLWYPPLKDARIWY